MTFEVAERSAVGRNLMTKACPPMLFALPGKICAEVTPPAIANSYDASCVFRPSMLRSHGRIGLCTEFPSEAPGKCEHDLFRASSQHIPERLGELYTPMCE